MMIPEDDVPLGILPALFEPYRYICEFKMNVGLINNAAASASSRLVLPEYANQPTNAQIIHCCLK
jgi:hypothetical protein